MPWESITAIIIAGIALLSAVTTALIQRPRLQRIERAAVAANEQVSNEHTSNLRDDVDRIEEKVDTLTDTMTRHILSAKEADTERDRRLTNFIADVRAEMRGDTSAKKERRWQRNR